MRKKKSGVRSQESEARKPKARSVGPTVPLQQLPAAEQMKFRVPSLFAREVLRMPLTPQQGACVDAFRPNRAHVSAVFCNEAGKTTKLICALVLWHLTVFPRRGENGGVTCTSGSWSQIQNQLMPALRAHAQRFPKTWDFLDSEIKRDGVPNFMAYSCSNPGRAEGFHGSMETPLMMLFDECKSVRDEIIRAGEDRCRPQRLGLFSSPGFTSGKFYESHTSEANYWQRFKVTVDDCPWIDRAAMKRAITRAGGGDFERGLQDPLIRSAFFAEFMPFVEGGLLSLSDIEECLGEPPRHRGTDRHAFCDFAAGGDENVLAVRRGNKVWIVDAWRDKNTMSAVGRFLQNFVKLREDMGLRPEEIEGDNDGLGNPMVSRLHEVGWPILPFHSNARALDAEKFRNRSSELWFNGAQAIQERRIIIPDDADLKGQLVDRTNKKSSDGRRWIESKEDMFRRQSRDQRPQRSPDRADAVLGAMGKLPVFGTLDASGAEVERNPYATFGPDVGEPFVGEMSVPEEVLRGFDAGS